MRDEREKLGGKKRSRRGGSLTQENPNPLSYALSAPGERQKGSPCHGGNRHTEKGPLWKRRLRRSFEEGGGSQGGPVGPCAKKKTLHSTRSRRKGAAAQKEAPSKSERTLGEDFYLKRPLEEEVAYSKRKKKAKTESGGKTSNHQFTFIFDWKS